MEEQERLSDIETLFHLTLALHHLNRDVERRYNLSLVQLSVLMKLRHLPASSALALAKAVGVHPSTLTQTLGRLKRKEFVFVTEDPKDSRKKLIVLTKSGKEAADSACQRLEKVFAATVNINREKAGIISSLKYLTSLRKRITLMENNWELQTIKL